MNFLPFLKLFTLSQVTVRHDCDVLGGHLKMEMRKPQEEATQGMPQCIKVRDMWPSTEHRERERGKHPAGKTGTHCIFY